MMKQAATRRNIELCKGNVSVSLRPALESVQIICSGYARSTRIVAHSSPPSLAPRPAEQLIAFAYKFSSCRSTTRSSKLSAYEYLVSMKPNRMLAGLLLGSIALAAGASVNGPTQLTVAPGRYYLTILLTGSLELVGSWSVCPATIRRTVGSPFATVSHIVSLENKVDCLRCLQRLWVDWLESKVLV